MNDQIREQVSAFLDGELPNSEAELLLKRLTRDGELRESFGRYALIGESLRGGDPTPLSQGFTAKVNRCIDGEGSMPAPQPARPSRRWGRSFMGAAMAAGVAAAAVVALQQRALTPSAHQGLALRAQSVAAAPREALSYTVPSASSAGTPLPAARLTNYVFAHSKYSSVLGHSNVLSNLLSDADTDDTGAATAGIQDTRVAP